MYVSLIEALTRPPQPIMQILLIVILCVFNNSILNGPPLHQIVDPLGELPVPMIAIFFLPVIVHEL